MATNIVNIGFKGTYPSTTADRTGYVSAMDTNDIFYYLGTNYGTQSWTNPNGGPNLTTSLSNAWSAANNANTLTDNSTGGGVTENSNDGLIATFNFLTCKVQPTRIDVASNWNMSTSGVNWTAEASEDGINWETIVPVFNVGFTTGGIRIHNFTPVNATKYYSYIRLRLSSSNSNATDIYHSEVKIYGKLFRTDGGLASYVSPVTTVEQLPKYIPDDLHDGDLLYYSGGIVTTKRRKLYETERLTMTGTLVISPKFFPNFYILNPNGAVRNIDLPAQPLDEQFLRFKTLDPLNAISIREGGTTTIATLNTSFPIVDLYYSNNTWSVISYG
jgi:hypothetical protein